MRFEWFRAYVESLLREVWDGDVVEDGDGDWPFRHGTAACWVAARPYPSWRVEVFAHVAFEVKQSARLLRELNEMNGLLVHGRVYWRDGVVVAATGIQAEHVDEESLIEACAAIGAMADDLGALLAAMFDGRTPFPVQLEA